MKKTHKMFSLSKINVTFAFRLVTFKLTLSTYFAYKNTNLHNMNYQKITSFETNKKNPFIDDLLEIEVSNRKRILAGKSPNYIIDPQTGEVNGTQVLAVYEKVDKERFTKVYHQGLVGMFDLSKSGIKVFSFIASIARPNKDEVIFDIAECKEFTGYKTHQPIMTGLSELIKNNFIARSERHYKYYINPAMFFNGSRVAFMTVYHKEEKEEKPKQLEEK